MFGKKSDILVIYPELNMSKYECDNNNHDLFLGKKRKKSDRQVLSI